MLPIFSIFPIPTKGCLPFRKNIIIIIIIINNNNNNNNHNNHNIIINNNLAIPPKNIMSKALENWGLKGSSFIFGCQNAGRGSGGGAGWDTSTLFQPFCWIPVTSKLDGSVLRCRCQQGQKRPILGKGMVMEAWIGILIAGYIIPFIDGDDYAYPSHSPYHKGRCNFSPWLEKSFFGGLKKWYLEDGPPANKWLGSPPSMGGMTIPYHRLPSWRGNWREVAGLDFGLPHHQVSVAMFYDRKGIGFWENHWTNWS